MDAPAHTAALLPARYAVARLAADAPYPEWARGPLVSLTRTDAELSVVCPEAALPAPPPAGLVVQRGFRALAVDGPLDFALVGLLAAWTGALAAAGVSVFALSTHDTDLLLVPAERLAAARAALAGAGLELRDG